MGKGNNKEVNTEEQPKSALDLSYNVEDLNLSMSDFTYNQLETQTEKDLLAAGSSNVSDPCAGKTGVLLSACKMKEVGKQWEIRNGIFFSEGRADAAPNNGSKVIIRGKGIKWQKGF